MGTRTLIIATTILLAGIAWVNDQTTVAAIAVATGAIMIMLHAIEVKVNKLLDDRGITVTNRDL